MLLLTELEFVWLRISTNMSRLRRCGLARSYQFSLPIYPAWRFRLQPLEPFDEQKENAGPETEQHDGNAGGDAPERAKRSAAVATSAHKNMAGHGDEEFKNAAAQQPARAAFEQ